MMTTHASRLVRRRPVWLFCLLALLAVATVPACVMGPVRYKTQGYRQYSAAELPQRSTPLLRFPAAVAGAGIDAGIIVLDTVATPVVAIPLAFEYMGPDPQPTTKQNVGTKLLVAPLWYPITYIVLVPWMTFGSRESYANWFGPDAAGIQGATTQPSLTR